MRRIWFTTTTCGVLALASTLAAAPPVQSLRRGPPAFSPSAAVPLPAAAVPLPAAAAAAPAVAPRGVSQAAGDTARMTNGLSQAASSLSRVPPTVRPMPAAVGPIQRPLAPIVPSLPQPAAGGADAVQAAGRRTLDLRLQQADHLSEIAGQNGNDRLGDAAERMRNQAQEQFNAAGSRMEAMPFPPEQPQPGIVPMSTSVPVSQLPVAKPSWRSRVHFAWPFNR